LGKFWSVSKNIFEIFFGVKKANLKMKELQKIRSPFFIE